MQAPTASGRARRRPTLEDVAAAAGVSKGLVSMVLNGSRGPSAATRERVLAVAAGLGYRSNRSAALLARRRTRLLGVTLLPGSAFHGELVEEIQDAADAAGYEVVLSSVTRAHDEAHAVETLVDSRCEALLLLGPELPAERLSALVEGVPAVVVGRSLDAPGVDVVRADDARGVTGLVEHLVALGHQRLAHVDGGPGPIARERARAYARAVRAHGLPVVVLQGGLTEAAGAAALDALPRWLPGEDPVTALVAFNDRSAVGVVDRLERDGVLVPRDVSVTGFDDSPLAGHLRIDLTSVGQAHVDQARVAVRLALERLEGGRTERREVVVPIRVVVRGSTAPPRPTGAHPETSP